MVVKSSDLFAFCFFGVFSSPRPEVQGSIFFSSVRPLGDEKTPKNPNAKQIRTLNDRLPLQNRSYRAQTPPKHVSDDPQHFIFRSQNICFSDLFRVFFAVALFFLLCFILFVGSVDFWTSQPYSPRKTTSYRPTISPVPPNKWLANKGVWHTCRYVDETLCTR